MMHKFSDEKLEKKCNKLADEIFALNQKLKDRICELFELDEQPCNLINKDALKTALEICKLFNCEILEELIVMRKLNLLRRCLKKNIRLKSSFRFCRSH